MRLRLEVKQPESHDEYGRFKFRSSSAARRRLPISFTRCFGPTSGKESPCFCTKRIGSSPTGSLFVPPDKLRPLEASQMNEALFGSDLSYQDIIENFFGMGKPVHRRQRGPELA